MRGNLFWLSDEQWCRIELHLPRDVRGKERVDDRRVISGILHVLKSGCRWCDCPPEYGPPTTIYNLYKFLFDLTDGGNWLVDVHASS
jgi:transposase